MPKALQSGSENFGNGFYDNLLSTWVVSSIHLSVLTRSVIFYIRSFSAFSEIRMGDFYIKIAKILLFEIFLADFETVTHLASKIASKM